ncbi:MAG TPA: hypothetical protein PLQ76_05440, partial [bacterium]|nr:hypothetical protein [bacterium]
MAERIEIDAGGLRLGITTAESNLVRPVLVHTVASRRDPDFMLEVVSKQEVRLGRGFEIEQKGDCFLFGMQGVDCRLDIGKREGKLDVVPDAGALEYAMKVIISVLLLNRGGAIFHAAGIIVGGAGLVFAGPHAAGKSTVASYALEKGLTVIDDENIIIARAADGRFRLFA